MTQEDFDSFKAVLARLARGFNRKADDEIAVDLFEDLRRFDLSAIEQAAERLRGQKFYPKLHDWREQLQIIEGQSAQRARQSLTSSTVVDSDGHTVMTFACRTCQDTCWAPACGCDMVRIEMISGRCPEHGAEGGEQSAQAYKPCRCRSWNAAWRARGVGRLVEPNAA